MSNIVPIQNPPSTDSDSPPTFEDFWLLYPRHTAKKVALKSWQRLTQAEQVQAMIAVEAWRRIWQAQGTEWQFIPMPATWLNQGRFDDDYPPWFDPKPPQTAQIGPRRDDQPAKRSEIPPHVKTVLARLKGLL